MWGPERGGQRWERVVLGIGGSQLYLLELLGTCGRVRWFGRRDRPHSDWAPQKELFELPPCGEFE